MDTKAEVPPPPFPSTGTGFGVDYDLKKHQFNVPIVSEQLLLQKGGNFIETYVPPSIVLNDKRKFVLVSHKAKDLYDLEQAGMATVHANEKDMPIMPIQNLTRQTGFQDRVFYLVDTKYLAQKGLMSQLGKNPLLSLRVTYGRPPIPFHVVNPDTVKTNGLPTSGKFIMPAINSHGPYPLKLHKQESFAIPPKPKDGLNEYAKADENKSIPGWVSILVVIPLLVLVGVAYLQYSGVKKRDPDEEISYRNKEIEKDREFEN